MINSIIDFFNNLFNSIDFDTLRIVITTIVITNSIYLFHFLIND